MINQSKSTSSADINLNKRQFLQGAGSIGASLFLAGMAGSASANQAKHNASSNIGAKAHGKIIGHGDFKYKVNYTWGNLDPSKVPVENSHGLDFDSKGRLIMVTEAEKNNFIIYDKDGKCVESWGTQHPGAHTVKVSRENGEDFLYIVDSGWVLDRNRPDNQWKNKWYRQNGFISKLTLDGKLVYTIGHPCTTGFYTPDMRFQPNDISIAPNGDLYVTDGYGSDYVIHYDSNGKYIRHWGGWKNADKNLNLSGSHGISIDTRDPNNHHLVVSNRGKRQLKKYTLDGQFIENIEMPGAYVGAPIYKGDYGYAAVCWSHIDNKMTANSGFITILDKQNKVISNPGGEAPKYVNGQLQTMRGSFDTFLHCHTVAVDDDENLYVGQWNANQCYPIKLERV